MTAAAPAPTRRRQPVLLPAAEDPEWYRSGVIYEMHVRSFADSNGDGIGDFPGLTAHLDYIADLGVTAIWLLPFYPSPGRDDGYDIADYLDVNPDYGTLAQFRKFLRAAHDRGLRVITELVVNHTSDQHPWFERARRAPAGSQWRDFYVWSDDANRWPEARIIFSDTETSNWAWDPVAEQYYWHRFFSHQPDLNYDHPAVRSAITRVVDFWFGIGVDGLRLDAVPYLYQRDGTNGENLPETHAFLRDLRAHVDRVHPGRMLLAEANQWPEDAAEYFGNGDECHMNFHFPLMPRLFMALQMEQRTPIVDILEQTPALPDGAQWATFLRNHDELTLEMVTDEERDYMYRAYANDPQMRINVGIRRRLAPLLGNDRRRIELLNAVLYSLPGTPVLYYGDELGLGDNVYLGDRDGVRTPMQWSPDRNAGFSKASPHRLYLPLVVEPGYHYENVNVEAQQSDPSSLLWWMSQLISLRKQHDVLGRGTVRFLDPENHRVLALLRELDGHAPFLAVANLSRHAQPVELDLSEFDGRRPREILGHTSFPPIGELPYFLTLAPYGFYWFTLEPPEPGSASDDPPPLLSTTWPAAIHDDSAGLTQALTRHLAGSRWFAGRNRGVRTTRVVDAIALPAEQGDPRLLIVDAVHRDGSVDTYHVPVLAEETAPHGSTVVATLPDGSVLVDAMTTPAGVGSLAAMATTRRARGERSELRGTAGTALRSAVSHGVIGRPAAREQSNSTAFLGDTAVIKLVRRAEPGVNPELEVGRHLSGVADFDGAPPVVGAVERRGAGSEPVTVAVVTEMVAHDDDAWTATADELARYFDRAMGATDDEFDPALLGVAPVDARRLGVATAELHLALASGSADYAPEPLGRLDRRAVAQGIRDQVTSAVTELRRGRRDLDAAAAELADEVFAVRSNLTAAAAGLTDITDAGCRMRIHGDLHLGQVLVSGDRYWFIDFEGEPRRPLSQRRLKRSPLVDLAGMVRSYEYAADVAARTVVERGGLHRWTESQLRDHARWWDAAMTGSFLDAYRERVEGTGLVPGDETFDAALRCFLVEKAAYELRYELDHRPDWVSVPLAALARLGTDA